MRRLLPVLLALAGAVPTAARAEDAPDPATYVPIEARAAAADGNTAFEKGDYEAARKAYRRVLDISPDNLVGLVNLGLVEFRASNAAEAEKLLKRAVQIRLETGAAWLTLGMLCYEQGRLDEAHAALAQAVLYDPGNARTHNFLGVTLGRKGWLDGAEAELRRAVEIDPSARDSHYNLAVIYLQRKPPAIELARRHYFRAVELGASPDPAIEKTLRENAPKP